jgi:hypothetical protein
MSPRPLRALPDEMTIHARERHARAGGAPGRHTVEARADSAAPARAHETTRTRSQAPAPGGPRARATRRLPQKGRAGAALSRGVPQRACSRSGGVTREDHGSSAEIGRRSPRRPPQIATGRERARAHTTAGVVEHGDSAGGAGGDHESLAGRASGRRRWLHSKARSLATAQAPSSGVWRGSVRGAAFVGETATTSGVQATGAAAPLPYPLSCADRTASCPRPNRPRCSTAGCRWRCWS